MFINISVFILGPYFPKLNFYSSPLDSLNIFVCQCTLLQIFKNSSEESSVVLSDDSDDGMSQPRHDSPSLEDKGNKVFCSCDYN